MTNPTAVQPAGKPARAKRARILVIDDDPEMLELARLHLESAGYEVVTAEDAIAAGHAVLDQPPDLIITDIMMPYMDGVEFAHALRADPSLPRIPLIFLTALEPTNGLARRTVGFTVLPKPLLVDQFLEAVARELELPRRGAR